MLLLVSHRLLSHPQLKMKKLIISMMLGASLLATIPSCSTNANNTATKTQQVIIPTVNAAMEQWAIRVKAGKATQSQVDAVKLAYTSYYTAQLAFKAALEKSINSASGTNVVTGDIALQIQSVSDAENALLAIVNQLLGAK